MSDFNFLKIKDDAVEWALAHGLSFKESTYSALHTPFVLTPTPISRDNYRHLKYLAEILSKLIYAASEDHAFLQEAIAPITAGDEFFAALLSVHQQIHQSPHRAKRLPLLIMRSDFMNDRDQGYQLIEFNGIAAGMGPFGQRIHELHRYLQLKWSTNAIFQPQPLLGELVNNHAIEELASGIKQATLQIKSEFND